MILLATSLLPLAALACEPGVAPVFSCATTKGKIVEVCQTASSVSYSYGKKGQKPEMFLTTPTAQLDWMRSSGSGMDMDLITFHNGDTAYALGIDSVYGQGDEDAPPVSARLEVRSGTKVLTTIKCREQGQVVHLENLRATPRPWE